MAPRGHDEAQAADLRSEDWRRLARREPRRGRNTSCHGDEALPGLPRSGDDPWRLRLAHRPSDHVTPEVAYRLFADAQNVLRYALPASAGDCLRSATAPPPTLITGWRARCRSSRRGGQVRDAARDAGWSKVVSCASTSVRERISNWDQAVATSPPPHLCHDQGEVRFPPVSSSTSAIPHSWASASVS